MFFKQMDEVTKLIELSSTNKVVQFRFPPVVTLDQ